jgi:hypothetical protein
MWVLLISLYLGQPLGQTESKGMIHAPHTSYEACLKARDQVRATWHLDGYRTTARCIWVKHYSTNNGAYNERFK